MTGKNEVMFGIRNRKRRAKIQFLRQLIQSGVPLIDVRGKAEFEEQHADGAVNIPLDQIDDQALFIKKEQLPVIVYCQSGRRSGIAADRLRNYGVEAYNAGGIKEMLTIINSIHI